MSKDSAETYPLRGTGDGENGDVDFYPPKRRKSISSGSSSEEDIDEQVNEERGEWGSKAEFFLAIMGYTVGIGSVWRFPIICSRNGGGAFLIPFFFFLITSGGPLYYMEVCLGQFTGKSAGLAFEFCPLLKGVGFLQVMLSLIVIWYLISILTWTFYFLYNSVFPTLPWTTCGNSWNTEFCQGVGLLQVLLSTIVMWYNIFVLAWTMYFFYNAFFPKSPWATCDNWWNTRLCKATSEIWAGHNNGTTVINGSNDTYTINNTVIVPPTGTNISELVPHKYSSSAFEFWEYNAVGRSKGLDDLGGFQLHLVICLFLAWAFVVLAVIKGVKTLGKVVYVTATVPFVFLGIMFVRGVTLDGAAEGMKAFVTPDFGKLLTFQVWLEAAIQVFYSLGPTWGGVITMASYNKFHQKSFWATAMCVVSVGFSSFFNGLVVFTILGFMAKQSGLPVDEVAKASGPGLAFVAFPTALSHMPLPQLWSVLFFLMLITVVFDSLFGMFETVTSGVIDFFPRQLTNKRVLVNIITGLAFFVCGLPLTMNGGIYIFQLADWYFSSFALLVGSALEAIGVCWFYGTDRFARDIEMMTGRYVSGLLRIMWSIIIPFFVILTFFVLLSRYSTPAYGDGYVYSESAIIIAIIIALTPIVGMVGIAIKEVINTRGGLKERIDQLLTPTHLWQPNHHDARETYRLQPYRYASTFMERAKLNAVGPKDNPMF